MKQKLKRLTSGLLSAVMVLTMIAGILPTMVLPTEAADPTDYYGRPIVSVSTYEELKIALESTEPSYICLANDITKKFNEYDPNIWPSYELKHLQRFHIKTGMYVYSDIDMCRFCDSVAYRIYVYADHTLNLNGFTLKVDESEDYFRYYATHQYRCDDDYGGFPDDNFHVALFKINDGVTFTVEDEWKKNATYAPPASQQGKILYNTDNPEYLSSADRIRCSIFVSGLPASFAYVSTEVFDDKPAGRLVINNGYYQSGTYKKYVKEQIGSDDVYYFPALGSVATLYQNNAEIVVNGGTLVGYNGLSMPYDTDVKDDTYTDSTGNKFSSYYDPSSRKEYVNGHMNYGVITVGVNCKVTINGGTFIGKSGANIISPLWEVDYVCGGKHDDRGDEYARNNDGNYLYQISSDWDGYLRWSAAFRYMDLTYSTETESFVSKVDVRGGEFRFENLKGKYDSGYGSFCPSNHEEYWMPKNINKYDVVTGSFSVAPSIGTPDITTETEYNGSSYETPGGRVDIGSEVSSRIKYVLWNPDTTLNMTANVNGGYYMADYAVKDMIAQQEDIYNGGGASVSRRNTTWKFWDNSDGKANVSGTPTFEREVYGDTLDLTSAKIPAAYKNVTKWIVRVEVKDELVRHSGLYKSLKSNLSTVFHIYVTDMPTSKLMLDAGYFGYELNHSKGGELLSFSPVESLQILINMYDLSSAAVTASLDGCTHNHVPYEDITCGTVTNTCDSVTFAVKYSLTDKNGNNMQFTLGENVPMMSVAVSNATKTGDDTYSFSGSAQLSVPASKTGDFNHNFTVGNWYVQNGFDTNGQPRWGKSVSAAQAITVKGTGVVTYSYIRNSDKKEFFAKPVSMVNANAQAKFEGDGLVFEKTDYRPGVVNQNSMLTICADEIPIYGSAERTGYFTMNLTPNAELKKRFDNDTAQITVMMTEYPEEYNYPDSGLYGALKYEYTPASADEKVFFWKFFESGYSSYYLRNGDYTFVAYAKDNNGNILAISKPVTITFEMVPSSREYGRLYDSETGEMVEESINLRVGEKTVLDFGFLDQYRGWNMDYTTIKSAVENTELGSGIIKVTPDYANKTVTIEALKEGTSGVLVNWNYKNAGGNSVDGEIGTRVNVYDTKVFEFDFADDIGYKRKVASPMEVDPLITDLTGAEDYVISWLTGTYNSGAKATYIDANKEVTAEIRLNTNEPFNPEVMNPDNIVVVIDGKEYTGRELNGWCTGGSTLWTFHFVWSFGTFHNDAYTYLETVEMDVKAPVAGAGCSLELPGDDAFENFTVTAIEVVQLTEGAGDNDSSNDEGFTCSASDTFTAGENYRIGFTLNAKTADKIYFDEDMTVLINGEESPKESVGEGFEEVIAYYYFTPKFGDGSKKPMTGFTVQAVTAPKTGAAPMTEGSLSLKGVAGELETSAIYVAGLTWYIDANDNGACDEGEIAEVQYQYNEETGEEEEIYVNLNDDGTFMAGTEYSVILAVALSNDEDEDGVDDTTGICLPENEEDIPDFPAVVDGEFVEMDKEYSDGMLVYTYTFPATEGDEDGLKGDVNLDGEVTVTDATALLRHVARIETITDAQALVNAEVTNDDELTVTDATKILRYVARIINSLED